MFSKKHFAPRISEAVGKGSQSYSLGSEDRGICAG